MGEAPTGTGVQNWRSGGPGRVLCPPSLLQAPKGRTVSPDHLSFGQPGAPSEVSALPRCPLSPLGTALPTMLPDVCVTNSLCVKGSGASLGSSERLLRASAVVLGRPGGTPALSLTWQNPLTSRSLHSFICKMGMTKPASEGHMINRGLTLGTQCQAHSLCVMESGLDF